MKKHLSLAIVAAVAFVTWGCQQTSSTTAKPAAAPAAEQQVAKVDVTDQGFVPAELTVKAGQPLKLTFTRLSDKTCATEVVINTDPKITKDLPLNTPVTVDLTPKTSEIAFACGMNMYSGKILVK